MSSAQNSHGTAVQMLNQHILPLGGVIVPPPLTDPLAIRLGHNPYGIIVTANCEAIPKPVQNATRQHTRRLVALLVAGRPAHHLSRIRQAPQIIVKSVILQFVRTACE